MESIQAFIFYIIQYTISNLNAFIILLSIGYSYYIYVTKNEEYKQLVEQNNSPIQLIGQLKGYFYINPVLTLSLTITIFSFAGIPPLIGFFAKQMVLSAALDSGYIFLALVAILTSVISAVYYLNIIKQLYYSKCENEINPNLEKVELQTTMTDKKEATYDKDKHIFFQKTKIVYKYNNIVLSSSLTLTISILTLTLLLFLFINKEILGMSTILSLILFKA